MHPQPPARLILQSLQWLWELSSLTSPYAQVGLHLFYGNHLVARFIQYTCSSCEEKEESISVIKCTLVQFPQYQTQCSSLVLILLF